MAIRTVVAGLGRIAYALERDRLRYHPCTHAGSLRELNRLSPKKKRFDLVGVCDRSPDKIEDFLRYWKEPVMFRDTNWSKLLEASRPDLAIISTSVPAHREIALLAMRAGVRAILLEKPVAENLSDAKAIQAEAKRTRTRVWVNFERRYHPAYRTLRKFIVEKRLGELRSIEGRVLAPASGDVGPLLHDAVHWIDLLLWYAGRPQSLAARLLYPPGRGKRAVEDTSFVSFRYPEFQALLEAGGRREYFEFFLRLDFERGRICSGNEGHFFYRSAASRRYRQFYDLRPLRVSIPKKNPWTELYREIHGELTRFSVETKQDFEQAQRRITANLGDAVAGMGLIHKCLQSGRV